MDVPNIADNSQLAIRDRHFRRVRFVSWIQSAYLSCSVPLPGALPLFLDQNRLRMRTVKRLLRLLLPASVLFLTFSSCAVYAPAVRSGAARSIPPADREFRAVWVATVDNIDWPSKPGLSTADQQNEARAILDTAARLHLNAIVLQVRPHCDAMYQSDLEPWSYYLTGEQGKAPDPFYDPLTFWIAEAHARGMELHVWFNPYRAQIPRGGPVTATSIVQRRPDLAKKLPNGTYWLDPGKQEVQDLSYRVVMDVVHRYDIDGVHFDDYFYPYGDGSFPDDDSWAAYQSSGGTLSREDWRRDNVNRFIHRVYDGIKAEKKTVKFGLSPFGIWRPSNPPSIAGFDQYSVLYADARLWLNKGWIDYWSPQLYWPISQVPQSFPVLLGWWTRENVNHRHIWPGMFTSRMTSPRGVDEIVNEIMIERGFVPDGPGHIHFSARAFLRDSVGLDSTLEEGVYQREALVPPSPWLDDTPPAPPRIDTITVNDTLTVTWKPADAADVFRWVVYYQYGNSWNYTILPEGARTFALARSRTITIPPRGRRTDQPPTVQTDALTRVAVSAVDRTGNECDPVSVGIRTMLP